MDDLDAPLRHATGGRLSYDAGSRLLQVRDVDGDAVRSVAVAREAVRNALQSALLAAGSGGAGGDAPVNATVDDAFAAGARALLAAYDADADAAERLVRRSAEQHRGTAAARGRRHG